MYVFRLTASHIFSQRLTLVSSVTTCAMVDTLLKAVNEFWAKNNKNNRY